MNRRWIDKFRADIELVLAVTPGCTLSTLYTALGLSDYANKGREFYNKVSPNLTLYNATRVADLEYVDDEYEFLEKYMLCIYVGSYLVWSSTIHERNLVYFWERFYNIGRLLNWDPR